MSHTHTTLALLLTSALLTLAACGDASDSTTPEDTQDTQTYIESVPSADIMSLSVDGTNPITQTQGLATTQQALRGPEGALRQHTENVMRGVHNLISETHQRVDRMVEEIEPQTIQLNALTCKQWNDDGARASWRVTACKLERRADTFSLLIEGRPLDAPQNADYLRVVAGESTRLETQQGKRRSRGLLAYNLDNLATLRGNDVSGRLVVGYHAAGDKRALNMGLRNVNGPDFNQPTSARYAFRGEVGKGASFRFLTHRDILTQGEDELTYGQDGDLEIARAAVAWSNQGAARTAIAICGGTLGQGQCMRIHQCWQADGAVTFEEVIDGDPNWERSSCADVLEDIQSPPTDQDVSPGSESEDMGVEVPEML